MPGARSLTPGPALNRGCLRYHGWFAAPVDIAAVGPLSSCPSRPRARPPNSSFAARARTTSRTSTSTLPPNALVIVTGRERVGQVVARLRHDLRRGAAPLRRVAVGLRPAVPRADGEARRRLDRGHLARPSRSARRTASATRARPSARPPRSTTTCACSTRGSAAPFCRNCGQEVVRESPEVVARRLAALPEGTRLIVGFEMPVVAAPKASNGNGADRRGRGGRTACLAGDEAATGHGATAANGERVRRLGTAPVGANGARPGRRHARRPSPQGLRPAPR